ncbi:hypothetical protein M8C21_026100 [Ambrosia artemisiifolia]|uniref:Uncharacterized protein n=1 Tax=Ambrosia artemisiifolia TaxID=4212 RepID=A0AAD5GV00_AMBAR|nr:hypothetical protein M8C21_026100 [Ambrosia artemisiifolia]
MAKIGGGRCFEFSMSRYILFLATFCFFSLFSTCFSELCSLNMLNQLSQALRKEFEVQHVLMNAD